MLLRHVQVHRLHQGRVVHVLEDVNKEVEDVPRTVQQRLIRILDFLRLISRRGVEQCRWSASQEDRSQIISEVRSEVCVSVRYSSII